jgi:hypothetical protein
MIFIENKYTKWYYAIITVASARSLTKNIYYESHHIIPRSLGGSNSKYNLVNLTAREHFICHKLLTKMTTGKEKSKMIYALWAMCTLQNDHQLRHEITSIQYSSVRKLRAEEQTLMLKGKPRNSPSEETRRKISNSLKGRKLGPQSPEHIAKRAAACKGRPSPMKGKKKSPMSDETKLKLSQAMLGVRRGPIKDDRRHKIAASKRGTKRQYLPDGSFIMVKPSQEDMDDPSARC